jgi:hypothetical protein
MIIAAKFGPPAISVELFQKWNITTGSNTLRKNWPLGLNLVTRKFIEKFSGMYGEDWRGSGDYTN